MKSPSAPLPELPQRGTAMYPSRWLQAVHGDLQSTLVHEVKPMALPQSISFVL